MDEELLVCSASQPRSASLTRHQSLRQHTRQITSYVSCHTDDKGERDGIETGSKICLFQLKAFWPFHTVTGGREKTILPVAVLVLVV